MSIREEPVETGTPHFSWATYIATVFFVGLFFGSLGLLGMWQEGKATRADLGFFALGVIVSGIAIGSLVYFPGLLVRKVIASLSAKDANVEIIRKTSEELQGALEQDFVSNLVRINFKYI